MLRIVFQLLIPANALLAAKARKLQIRQMKYKDERIKLISEILSGVKVRPIRLRFSSSRIFCQGELMFANPMLRY